MFEDIDQKTYEPNDYKRSTFIGLRKRSLGLVWIILDRHTSYNINDLKVPSSVTNI
jgi:hypothetical protein